MICRHLDSVQITMTLSKQRAVIFWYLTRAKTDAGFAKSALSLKIKEDK